jgi:putative FmdB family regulatory protein
MPTYEYECEKCHHLFEQFQKITDEPLKTCPVCGAKVKRLISGGGGLLFKGNGFYITDHRSESYKRKAREEKGLPTKKEEKPTAQKTE